MGSMRTFIACADERLRLALLLLLHQEPGIVVVGLSDRLAGILAQLEGAQPDVLLLDWELSDQSMMPLLTDIHDFEFQPKIIIFSAKLNEKEKIMAAGADFFICKDAPPDELLPILNTLKLPKTENRKPDT